MYNERLVVIVVFDGVQMLDAIGPAEVFASASRHSGSGTYRLLIASLDGLPVRSDSGLHLGVDVALDYVGEPVDTLIVAGGQGAVAAAASRQLLSTFATVSRRSRRVCSVCTGAFVLAAGGWLSGKSATTHWSATQALAQQFPDISVEPDRIFVQDGDVFTSGGVSAGMDLALTLVETDHDAHVARAVAQELVLFLQRPGGQSQFSEHLVHRIPAKSPLRAVVDTVVAEPAADHRLVQMAARAGVSERHLTRLFRLHADMTPAEFVERVRIGVAREQLERTTLGMNTVATRSGFGSSETLRRAFIRTLGVPPSEYRQRFSTAGLISARTRQIS
ncbi:GlxA family transcriptional regulator [Rhodococcus fascians]|uniref:GlxA family transcriptional regulator n=1 Tax=Rhodococcoides fascians TaxID=1828 RepID=UPI0009B88265|nr:GlxA family transcriptional regulator [Rhodococcus fascians]MBY4383780.1 GlxA family transcriptional regulator [Rhodococcus fascians]MBY4398991.1 GlxA family transcriptional regulator [Rhodococcus fascians]MBY4408529.1 GlxA family transcriptional regulator [Rhodococcus fascians]MBY4423568.1 GlxA family transcriptional regulator [Rhodococcus fascians]MBY4462908.1 GlxA family transcriptional regulator [Rhodococcus fascians]